MTNAAEFIVSLRQIGLTEKEAMVYLALLSLGTGTAYEIAQHCDVKKPTVYVILEDLRKRGLILKVPHAKKALFSPVDMEEYLRAEKKKIDAVHKLLPEMRALGGTPSRNVYFFTGLNGLAQALDYKIESMRGKTFHSYYEDLSEGAKGVADLYARWDKKALAMNIAFKIVMGKQYSGKHYKDLITLTKTTDLIAIKYLEKDTYPPNVSMEIAKDFVRITNEKELQTTIIDDRATADAMRQIFKIVWEKGA